MKERYKNNIGTLISEKNQEQLLKMDFAVLGCGGQGGYIIDFLCRLGVHKIVIFDGDTFEESNLNRQLGATESTIGKNKALVMQKYISNINADVEVVAIDHYFGQSKDDLDLVLMCNFVFDEMDYSAQAMNARMYLRTILESNIPITAGYNELFGSCISILTINDLDIFDIITQQILQKNTNQFINNTIAQPAYTCAATASLEVFSMIKLFLGGKHAPTGEFHHFDFYHNVINKEDRFGQY